MLPLAGGNAGPCLPLSTAGMSSAPSLAPVLAAEIFTTSLRGCPFRDQRVGKAANPGPRVPGTPNGGERNGQLRRDSSASPDTMAVDAVGSSDCLYCPVQGYPSSDPIRAPGWTSKTTLISHVDSHLAGTLQGHVPAQWFLDHRRQYYTTCDLRISMRHGVHPTCQPSVGAILGAGAAVRPAADTAGLPSLDDAQARQIARFVISQWLPTFSAAPWLRSTS